MDGFIIVFFVVSVVTLLIAIVAFYDGAIGAGCGLTFCGVALVLVVMALQHSESNEVLASKFINRECSTKFTSREIKEFPEAVFKSLGQNPCKEIVEHILTPSKGD